MAFKGLIESRRFWVLILDTIVSTALYFVGKYAVGAIDDLKFVTLALQPVFLLVIYGFTKDNEALIQSGKAPGGGA